jgi:hypothetical protein
MSVAEGIVAAAELYALAGAVFALWFVTKGAPLLDPAAGTGSAGLRLLLLPGAAALWPFLLMRCREKRTAA